MFALFFNIIMGRRTRNQNTRILCQIRRACHIPELVRNNEVNKE